jgi:hypothetical protein
LNKLWITPCCYDSIVLFQITSSVLSRCHGHSLDRYEDAIHPSGRLQCIQLSSGDHRSVYTSILSTHTHPLKTSHRRETFLRILKNFYSGNNYGFGFGDKVMDKNGFVGDITQEGEFEPHSRNYLHFKVFMLQTIGYPLF